MAKGSEIIVTSDPRGRFLEGTIYGTPKPGTIMEIKPGVAPVGGRFTWQAFQTSADGKPGLIAVLLPDSLQGKLATDAYVSGTRGFIYCPVAGEELNVLIQNLAGTADDHTIGELMSVDNPTGMLIVNSNFGMVPFICLEPVTDPVADTLTWVMYSGH